MADYTSQWKYFKSLLFLKDQFTPRKGGGNLIEDAQETILEESTTNLSQDGRGNDYDSQNSMSMEGQTIESARDILSSRPSTSPDKKSQKKRSNQHSLGDALLQVEKDKLQYLKEKRAKREEDDEDLNFFKSLLPHVTKFSAYDKMEYRIRVMKITQELLNPTRSTASASSDYPDYFTSTENITESPTLRIYYENADTRFSLPESVPNS